MRYHRADSGRYNNKAMSSIPRGIAEITSIHRQPADGIVIHASTACNMEPSVMMMMMMMMLMLMLMTTMTMMMMMMMTT